MKMTLNRSIFLFLTTLTTSAFSIPPKQLITHNYTDVESNAFVAGTIPSRHPVKAHTDSKVAWTEVRMACFGHVVDNKCPALVKMGTGPEDGGNPVDIGYVTMDLNTGLIAPSRISGNGYTLTVNGAGETTLTKD